MTLKTEDPQNGQAAVNAFFKSHNIPRSRRSEYGCVSVFEHGQLWIVHLKTGAIWSVVDAEGGPAVDGFDFEVVCEGVD